MMKFYHNDLGLTSWIKYILEPQASPILTTARTPAFIPTIKEVYQLSAEFTSYYYIYRHTGMVSLQFAEKHFPANHLQKKKHFPERSFSRINICQNHTCQKLHLPE